MKEQEAIKKYVEYYTDENNIKKIWESVKLDCREVALYNKFFKDYKMKRHFSVVNIDFLKTILNFNCLFWCKKGINKMYNLYYTMAEYKHPYPATAYKEHSKRWNFDTAVKKTKFIPFVLDIDALEMKYLKEEAKIIINFLNLLESPKIYYTGMGFHIVDDVMGKKLTTDMDNHTAFAEYLQDKYSDFIDLKIYDYRRILKLPNSLAVYVDNPELNTWRLFKVAEIKQDELNNFNYKKYEIV